MARIVPLILGIAFLASLASCGDDSMDRAQPAADKPAAPEPAAAEPAAAVDTAARRRGPLVKLRGSELGPVLFSGRDQAVYYFTRDGAGRSRCHGDCAEAWPPFFARGRPRAGRGVKRSLLGTIRRGGRRQVTYNGHRLYFYVSDPKGVVLCNDIVEFGGSWFAVTAEGDRPA